MNFPNSIEKYQTVYFDDLTATMGRFQEMHLYTLSDFPERRGDRMQGIFSVNSFSALAC